MLDLRDNEITDIGARHLADALKVNTTLKILQLTENPMTASGLKKLADALAINTTLETLLFEEDNFSIGPPDPDYQVGEYGSLFEKIRRETKYNKYTNEMKEVLRKNNFFSVEVYNKLFKIIRKMEKDMQANECSPSFAVPTLEFPSLLEMTFNHVNKVMSKKISIEKARRSLPSKLFSPLIKGFFATKNEENSSRLKLLETKSMDADTSENEYAKDDLQFKIGVKI